MESSSPTPVRVSLMSRLSCGGLSRAANRRRIRCPPSDAPPPPSLVPSDATNSPRAPRPPSPSPSPSPSLPAPFAPSGPAPFAPPVPAPFAPSVPAPFAPPGPARGDAVSPSSARRPGERGGSQRGGRLSGVEGRRLLPPLPPPPPPPAAAPRRRDSSHCLAARADSPRQGRPSES